MLILRGTKTPGDQNTETPIFRHKGAVAQTFLAVQNRSIGDIVSHDYNDCNDYNDYDDYNNYNNYIDYNGYNDYNDYNDYKTTMTTLTTITTKTKRGNNFFIFKSNKEKPKNN